MDWTGIKDLLLTIGMVIGPVATFFAMLAKLKSELEKVRLETEAATQAKRIEAQTKADDNTGAHILAAWKITLEEVKNERAALAEERRESQHERQSAEHARTQSKLDNELASIAVKRHMDCQEELAALGERLSAVEKEHDNCPAKIKKLETDIALLRYQLGLSVVPPA